MSEFVIINLKTWSEIKELFNIFHQPWYRGQCNSEWNIVSSLERLVTTHKIPYYDLHAREKDTIREIKKKKHLLKLNIPPEDDLLGWLSIIRHYGGPTRLIDFTFSPYIAAFFAVEDFNKDGCIWLLENSTPLQWLMINEDKFPKSIYGFQRQESCNMLGNDLIDQDTFQQTLTKGSEFIERNKFIINVSPIDFTNRIANQQGFFVLQSDMNVSFMENMYHSYSIDDNKKPYKVLNTLSEVKAYKQNIREKGLSDTVYKIVIDKNSKMEIKNDLNRMNIRYDILFPDIDGFIRQLFNNFEMEYTNK